MPFETDGSGYGIMYPGPNIGPERTQDQVPPLEYTEESGAYLTRITVPRWLERGTTGRITIAFEHTIDGAIAPVNQTAIILDGNGNVFSTQFYSIVQPVTQDQGSLNSFYVEVAFNGGAPPGVYVVDWVGYYTPNNQATQERIEVRRPFRVKVTAAPGQFFLKSTSQT